MHRKYQARFVRIIFFTLATLFVIVSYQNCGDWGPAINSRSLLRPLK